MMHKVWHSIEMVLIVMLNTKRNLCSGMFTRSTINSVTLLGYALVDQGALKRVNCMISDEMNHVLSPSDHSLILVELDLGVSGGQIWEQLKIWISSPMAKQLTSFKLS